MADGQAPATHKWPSGQLSPSQWTFCAATLDEMSSRLLALRLKFIIIISSSRARLATSGQAVKLLLLLLLFLVLVLVLVHSSPLSWRVAGEAASLRMH